MAEVSRLISASCDLRRFGERLEHGDLAVELGGVAGDDEVAGLHIGAFGATCTRAPAPLGDMQRRSLVSKMAPPVRPARSPSRA